MTNQSNLTGRDVYIIDGSRTPYLKAGITPGSFSASDLAVSTTKQLLQRQPFSAQDVDELIAGCVMPSEDEANIARVIALRLGCGYQVPAWTVQRNCASGMQALDNAAQNIGQGRSNLVIAGGTEAMSRAPLILNQSMTAWFARWYQAKTWGQKAKLLTQIRPSYFSPIIALLRGLRDPVVGLSMGQTAENLADRFSISREQMDEYALRSHQRLAQAFDTGRFAEITPIYDHKGHYYDADTGLRRDSDLAKLAKLKPIFDKPFGLVTAGNSSQVTDGAAFLILASQEAVEKYDLPVLAKIIDIQWAALDPAYMGLGPVHATTKLLERQQLKFDDIYYWEINEAFAAQVLVCIQAWQDEKYCKEELNLNHIVGHLNQDRLNVDGGAIAMGHPVGASGARIVLHLLKVLQREQAKRGVATICIGGGQGGSMLIESMG